MPKDIDKLVDDIYEAAVEPNHWEVVLRDLSEVSGDSSVYLCHVPLTNPNGGNTWTHEFDPDCLDAYKRHYAGPHYQGVRAILTNPIGSVFDRRQIARDDEFLRDPGHHAFLIDQGLMQGLISTVHRDGHTLSALLCMRKQGAGPIEGREREAVAFLTPHLTRAIRVNQKTSALRDEANRFAGVLDSLSVGVISVDRNLSITFANTEADRILSLSDGLTQRNGKLVISRHPLQVKLESAVAQAKTNRAKEGPTSYVFVPRPSGAADYSLLVTSANHNGRGDWSSGTKSAATIFVNDPASLSLVPEAGVLIQRFGLTATEASVARLIASGQGAPYVAKVLSTSLNTVRTHLKSLYSKTGVHNQAQLSRQLLEAFPPVKRFSS